MANEIRDAFEAAFPLDAGVDKGAAQAVGQTVQTQVDAVEDKADTALARTLPLIDYPADASVRPGKNPVLFGPDLTGRPAATAAYAQADVVSTTYGEAIEKTGPWRAAPRDAVPIIDDHVYRVTFGVAAATDPSDPEGDSMQLALRWLNGGYATIATRVVENKDLRVDDGVYIKTAVLSKVGTEGQNGLDILIPPTAHHFRMFAESFSATARRQVHILSVEDVTNAAVVGGDVSALTGRTTALEGRADGVDEALALAAADLVAAVLRIVGLEGIISTDDSQESPYAARFRSSNRRLFAAFAKADARFWVHGLGMFSLPNDDSPYWSLTARGRRFFGWTKRDGRYFGRMTDESLAQLWADLTDKGFPAASSGAPATKLDIELGDSKSIGASGSLTGQATVFPTAPWPTRALMLNRGVAPGGPADTTLAPKDFWETRPAQDGVNTSQGVAFMDWLIERQIAAGETKPRRIFYSNGIAGRTVAELSPGTQLYENGVEAIKAAVRIEAEEGRRVEADAVKLKMATNDRGNRSAAQIQAAMGAIATAIAGDIVEATGQPVAPFIIISQTEAPADNYSAATTYNINDVALGQMALAETRPDVIIAHQPHYALGDYGFVNEGSPHALHGLNRYSALDGEAMAEAEHAVMAARKAAGNPALPARDAWKGFVPTTVTRAGATLTVSFSPLNLVAPLLFEVTADFPDAGNFGFAAFDADGVTELPLASAPTIAGWDVILPLAANPGHAVYASAGWKVGPGATLRSGTWINLRDSAEIPSKIYPGGKRPHFALTFKRLSTS